LDVEVSRAIGTETDKILHEVTDEEKHEK